MNHIFDQFVVVKPDQHMDRLPVSPNFYQQLGEKYGDFHCHTLVSAYEFTEDWSTWEKHPAGDEMVVLLSGKVKFVLRRKEGDEVIELTEAGSYVVVPRDTWHTARVSESTRMLFITPGEGTRNEVSPEFLQ